MYLQWPHGGGVTQKGGGEGGEGHRFNSSASEPHISTPVTDIIRQRHSVRMQLPRPDLGLKANWTVSTIN